MSEKKMLSIEELRARDQIIEHHTPGNVLFPEPKQCSYCNTFFSCSHDMNHHLNVFGKHPHGKKPENSNSLIPAELDLLGWRPSNFDDGEYCPSDKNPSLKRACQMRGSMLIGLYQYFLSKNGKWIRRRKQ